MMPLIEEASKRTYYEKLMNKYPGPLNQFTSDNRAKSGPGESSRKPYVSGHKGSQLQTQISGIAAVEKKGRRFGPLIR